MDGQLYVLVIHLIPLLQTFLLSQPSCFIAISLRYPLLPAAAVRIQLHVYVLDGNIHTGRYTPTHIPTYMTAKNMTLPYALRRSLMKSSGFGTYL